LPFLLFPSDAGHKYVENQFLIRLQNIPSAWRQSFSRSYITCSGQVQSWQHVWVILWFSVVRCSRELWKKNGLLLSHVFWRAFNFNYKYIFTVH
jgi:hypothetical protein